MKFVTNVNATALTIKENPKFLKTIQNSKILATPLVKPPVWEKKFWYVTSNQKSNFGGVTLTFKVAYSWVL